MEYIYGHTSPETARVVDDYPYGFRLRCKIRYWVEYHAKRGFRMVGQTTNPKVAGEVWNKPKASTYARFGLVMGIDDEGHIVNADSLTEYNSLQECREFQAKHGAHMPTDAAELLALWIQKKQAFEDARARGQVVATTTVREGGKTTTTRENLGPTGSGPRCVFCKRSGDGVQFVVFSPRFPPFGTACADCEKTLPPGTTVPTT